MTEREDSRAGSFQVPKFGKDHLTLADWRTGVLRFQQPRDEDGNLPETLSAGFARPDGAQQQVVLERGTASEFPTAGDEDVILGLIYLAAQQEFPGVVHFVPSQLIRTIRWPLKQQSYERLCRALERYTKLTATFTGNWYDRQAKQVLPTLMTGIIAQAEVVTSRGRLAAGTVPPSHIQWTENFNTSQQEGNLLDIDLELLFSWKRPGTKDFHRHLNKVWHGGRKPRVYERDLRELACGHLGMKDCKDLKRNFHNFVTEMEQHGYLVPMPVAQRYQKIGTGIWRPRFELHPDHYRKKATTPKAVSVADPARQLVALYHRYRFDQEDYTPLGHELTKARELIAAHDLQLLLRVTKSVAEKVRSQGRDDLYFGFAAPYYAAAVQSNRVFAGFRQQQQSAKTTMLDDQQRQAKQVANRRHHRQQLLTKWSKLTGSQQEKARTVVADRATSAAVKRRLLACNLANPPQEVLAEIEHSPTTGAGEC